MDEDLTQYSIFPTLESPIPIMFWEPLEFILAIGLLGMFMILNLFTVGLVACVIVLKYSSKFKAGEKKGSLNHGLWRYGLHQVSSEISTRYPKPWVLEFKQ